MPSYSLTGFDAVLAIGRRGSFRAAALDLGMSTSGLSNAIAKLEGQLGVRLFNRTTRSVSLTEAGRRFVDQVTPALTDIHQALDTVRSQQETPSGTLRINTFATAGREILSPLVLAFLFMLSDVEQDIAAGRLVRLLEQWTPPLSPLCLLPQPAQPAGRLQGLRRSRAGACAFSGQTSSRRKHASS